LLRELSGRRPLAINWLIVGIGLLFPSRRVGSARARHRRKANARA
jgi:hypothetical protein